MVRACRPLLIFLLWLALFPLCDQVSASEKTIKIAYLPITHALTVFMEKELHNDNTFQVELIRYGSWPELMDALSTNRVDGACLLSVLAVKAREQGIPLKMVALGHHGGNVIVAASQIHTAHDLQGKTIAVPHRQSSHHLLVRRMLEKAGLTPDTVRIIELAPPEMPAALARGNIDAYCVAEPFGAQALALGVGKVLYHADDLWPDSLCCSLVFNETFVRNNPALAAQYVSAFMKAGEAIENNPDLARTVAARTLKLSGQTLDTSLGWINFHNLILQPEEYTKLTSLMVRYGLSDNPPSFEEMVTSGVGRH